ncbi:Golgin subfamily A member 7/ERF4 family-domain-containing protein [Trametes meyenii]|nr:Golgin subfamily A member 7/ERF4 family-domain-containing protein [Trametes meyenii]
MVRGRNGGGRERGREGGTGTGRMCRSTRSCGWTCTRRRHRQNGKGRERGRGSRGRCRTRRSGGARARRGSSSRRPRRARCASSARTSRGGASSSRLCAGAGVCLGVLTDGGFSVSFFFWFVFRARTSSSRSAVCSYRRPQKPPHSAYYFGPPPPDSAYGTDPVGQIGVHHPREVVRIERDYTGGELPQFSSTYPLELEGRITPTQFLETINAMNEILISAHSLGHSFVDNALAFFTLQASRAVKKSHYEKEMDRLKRLIDELNEHMYNPVGLHIKWPKNVAFLFAEIEYY